MTCIYFLSPRPLRSFCHPEVRLPCSEVDWRSDAHAGSTMRRTGYSIHCPIFRDEDVMRLSFPPSCGSCCESGPRRASSASTRLFWAKCTCSLLLQALGSTTTCNTQPVLYLFIEGMPNIANESMLTADQSERRKRLPISIPPTK